MCPYVGYGGCVIPIVLTGTNESLGKLYRKSGGCTTEEMSNIIYYVKTTKRTSGACVVYVGDQTSYWQCSCQQVDGKGGNFFGK